MREIFGETRFLVVTGNYGSGKTELALNLAFQAASLASEYARSRDDWDVHNPIMNVSQSGYGRFTRRWGTPRGGVTSRRPIRL